MLEAIGTGVTSAIGYVGDVLDALLTTEGALAGLLPIIGLGIAMGVIGFAVAKIKSLTWGF